MEFWKTIILNYLTKKNLKEFWQTLMHSWPQSSNHDKEQIFLFLYNNGLQKNFINLFLHELSMDQPQLPWPHLFALLEKTGKKIPAQQQKTIVAILKAQNIEITDAKAYHSVYGALMGKQRQRFLSKVQQRKDELLASARIAKSEQLHDQQLQYLRELRQMFPKDLKIRKNFYAQRVSGADSALTKSKPQRKKMPQRNEKEDQENKQWIAHIIDQAKELGKYSDKNLDLAFMIRQMGFPRESLHFLENSNEEQRSQWLLFDFLFASQQFVTLLSHCENMKTQASSIPEAYFAISYYQARALWELGEKQSAITLMQQISNMKPNFRSANDILNRWIEDAA